MNLFKNKKNIFFALIACIALQAFAVNSSFAAARGESGAADTDGTGLDGSDCASGLILGTNGLCLEPTDIACSLSSKCPSGQVCYEIEDGLVTSKAASDGGVCGIDKSQSVDNNPLTAALCGLYNFITGSTGRLLVALVIVATGVTFLLGKIDFNKMLVILAGTTLIFGAPFIMQIFIGGQITC